MPIARQRMKAAPRKLRMFRARARREAAYRMFAENIPTSFDDFALVEPLCGSQPIACLPLRFDLLQLWHRELGSRVYYILRERVLGSMLSKRTDVRSRFLETLFSRRGCAMAQPGPEAVLV